MCERYVVPDQMLAERELAPERKWWQFLGELQRRAVALCAGCAPARGRSEAVMMRWGLTPAWAKDDLPPGSGYGSRAPRSSRARSFAGPWLHGQRCILPFAGFYTWRLTPAGYRQPYFVQAADRPVFAVAALWDRYEDEDDDVIEGCAILTVPANAPAGVDPDGDARDAGDPGPRGLRGLAARHARRGARVAAHGAGRSAQRATP